MQNRKRPNFLKRLARSALVQETAGFILFSYIRLLKATNRLALDPPDAYARIGPMPVIAAMWHGQHFMIGFAKRPKDRAVALISRHGDGEFNAIALRWLGIEAIRGSGAPAGRVSANSVRLKGGASALRALLKALQAGKMAVLTADVPKIARVCGDGIILLAQLSGRPIVPVAVVTSRQIRFSSWDRASIGLPFGRGAVVIGEAISVARDETADGLEAARLHVQCELDRVHARAYALVGCRDPGAALLGARKGVA